VSASPELVDTRIDDIRVSAYEVPTATDEESDGTLIWNSTTLVVVELTAGDQTGLGYTYCDPSAGTVIQSKLASVVEEADPLMPQHVWAQMQMATRQLGHDGVAAMAVSAVDVALWDLKARLLGVCLADALPRYRESVPIYGSGGFCDYTPEQLRQQVQGWMEAGFRSVKIKVGRDADADPDRVALVRSVVGPDVDLMVDANGANSVPQAVEWAHRYSQEFGVIYFEEPVSSDDLAGLHYVRDHAPPGLAVAAGEYGWNLPYYQRMLDAQAVHILRPMSRGAGGSPTCCGSTGCARPGACPSPPTAPRPSPPMPVAPWRRSCTSSISLTTTELRASCSTGRSTPTKVSSPLIGRGPDWGSS
jgi:L-alanine-DL-glutamate epimerase-like enolase superfamily enzyme